ncbi:clostripain-related cysteine peptidase [Candidatus Viridilinea mediisalina]|uniref:Uncharacterized protein n=1 Tax=Candidatus Viridilinea mediisalina TaxID=2024553 RepID=A0A2A6RNC2_9CHLR|nr:clostripain-related cysteine peptidase [Candidatus Viridilinea mediisalina]PDW04537.1 hypothetical protein CJ255_03215 [Candidatus Viridilinea mediisalina]
MSSYTYLWLLLLLLVSPVALLVAQADQPEVAQVSMPCQQVLADPTVELTADASPWEVYAPTRSFSTEHAASGTTSLGLSAGAMVGQQISIPPNLGDLFGHLSYRLATGSNGGVEQVRVELYRPGQVQVSGLITTLALLDAAEVTPGDWLQLEWHASAETLAALADYAGAAVVFVVRSLGAEGASATTTQVWLDDLRLQLCQTERSVTLRGVVQREGLPLADAHMLLSHTSATGTRVYAAARSDATGQYGFPGVEPLAEGEHYRIWYLNTPNQARMSRQLGFWAGPELRQLPEQFEVTGLDFEVGDVTLLAPAPHASIGFNHATTLALRWLPRAEPMANERHRACLYDPAYGDPQTGLPQEWCSAPLNPARDSLSVSLRNLSGFVPVPGRSYRWYVRVSSGNQYGASFHERALGLGAARTASLVPAEQTIAQRSIIPMTLEQATLSRTRKPIGTPCSAICNLQSTIVNGISPAQQADWTLMIYVAADNALSDASRAALPKRQLEALPRLAATHPRVRLVSLVDSADQAGVQICSYGPQAEPRCEQDATASSASATTLGDFIALARERYPARRTALLIIAPGNGVGELAYAETTGRAMGLRDLQAAFQSAGLGGSTRLDLVIYQVPLFGNVDVLRTTAPFAHVMVATPDQVWQMTPYERMVALLAATSERTTVAQTMVEIYATELPEERALALAAYDLSRVNELGVRLDALADALASELFSDQANVGPAFTAARDAAQVYDSSANGLLNQLATSDEPLVAAEDALRDLRGFVEHLSNAPLREGLDLRTPAAAQQLAALLLDPQSSPVLTATQRAGLSITEQPIDLSASHGLAIYFPTGERLGEQQSLSETYLYESAPDSRWAALLRLYLSRSLPNGPGGISEALPGGPRVRPGPGGLLSLNHYVYLPLVAR